MYGLEIPCNEYIVIMLIEQDLVKNDGSAIRASCYDASGLSSGYDFSISGGDVARAFGLVVNVVNTVGTKLSYIYPSSAIIVHSTNFVLGLGSSFADENDAMYSLTLDV